MSTKQFGIIFTLAGLLVCVGLLSIKLNDGKITDPVEQAVIATKGEEEKNKGKEETKETEDFFYKSRSEREKTDAETVQSLKAAIADKSTSADVKENAQKELLRKTTVGEQEGRVENNVKTKGFSDVLCYIDNEKAKVFVKDDSLKGGLTQEISLTIKEIVQDVANISNVTIEVKK